MTPSRAETERLEALAQYLNLEELRGFCARHELPLYICAERPPNEAGAGRPPRRTGDRDRKDVVLRRILDFALTGARNGPTVYPLAVVTEGPLPSPLTARTRIHHGQYEKHNPAFVAKLVELTEGAYRNGMIARLVLRDFWTEGVAPTMKQFAGAWLEATAAHTQPRPEGAYLVDLARGTAGEDWKQKRIDKAREALDWLARLIEARA